MSGGRRRADPWVVAEQMRQKLIAQYREAALLFEAAQRLNPAEPRFPRLRYEASLQAGEVGRLQGEDVIRGNRLERLRSVLQLHGVPLLSTEVHCQLADEKIDCLHPAKSPTFVEAIAPGQKSIEGLAGRSG